MSQYPTPGDYQEALQFPQAAFTDPVLQEATPEENPLGLPRAITGAFAAVFPLRRHEMRWAVKCFLSEVPDQQARYRAIARHLADQALPYTIEFDYQSRGIRVGTRTLPLLKMAWVEGVPLNRFVADHLERPDVLDELARQWAAMLADLEAAGLAHGDLQHGNVLVTGTDEGRRLMLIDYDTLFVPALQGRRSPEVGHRNYQHPDRDEGDFGPYLDRFAGLVVYTALEACRLRPDLWARYDTGENLLFRAADFYDPAASLLFEELQQVEALAPLVEALQTACYLEPEAVPPLEAVRARPQRAGVAQAVQTVQAATTRRRRRERVAVRSRFEQLFLPAVLLGLVAAGLLLMVGEVLPSLALLAFGGTTGGWMAARRWARLPAVRRRRRLAQEAAYFERIIGELERQVAAREEERRRLRDSLADLKTQRLEELQAAALEDRLKYHFADEAATVEGISHKVVVRLKASGIRTAAHATPERLAQARGLSDESRTRVALWRASLAARYRDDVPRHLSPAEERRLQRFVQHRLANLEAEAARTREKIEVQQAERAQILARGEGVLPLSFLRYLRYLLRLGTLPPQRSAPPVPQPRAPAQPVASAAAERDTDDPPWWRQQ